MGFPFACFTSLSHLGVSSERLALLRGKPVEKASGPGKPVVGAVEMDHDFLNSRGSNVDGWLSGLWFQICFIFTPKIGEDSQFGKYFSHGLVQPPTSYVYNYYIPGALNLFPGCFDWRE